MAQLGDIDRTAFKEIAQNSFVEYTRQEVERLREIADELKKIAVTAKKRQQDKLAEHFDPPKAS